MVLLGVRSENAQSPMERETFLTPVDWSGPWPIVNPGPHQGRVDLVFTPPAIEQGKPIPTEFKASFDETMLAKEWSLIRTPSTQWWDLKGKPGWLTIRLRPDQLSENTQPSFLGIRVTQPNCVAETRVDFQPADEQGCAGLAILRSSTSCFMLVVEKKGAGRMVSVYQGGELRASEPVSAKGPVDLAIALKNDQLAFSMKQGADSWKVLLSNLDASALSTDPGGKFRGSMVGIYASSRGKESQEKASFDYFNYSAQQP